MHIRNMITANSVILAILTVCSVLVMTVNFVLGVICLFSVFAGAYFARKCCHLFCRPTNQKESEYQYLVENVSSLILKIDNKGVISFANSFAVDFFELDHDSLVGMPLLMILSGDRYTEQAKCNEVIDYLGKGVGPHERPYTKKNGDILWIAWRTTVSVNSNGKCEELLCVGNDITSKYKALEKLKNSEARYKSIFENAPLGIVYFNKAGQIFDCNDNLGNILGSSKDQLIGISKENITDSQMRGAIETAMMGQNSIFEDSYTSITSGRELFLRAIFSPVISMSPPFDVIGTLEDITPRKTVERQLAKSEQRLQGISKASPVGIIITDSYGKVQYANIQAVHMCNLTLEQMKKHGWTHSLGLKDKLIIFQKWFNSDLNEKDNIEFRVKKDDENYLWLLGQIVELDNADEEASGYVISLTDISALKAAEFEHKRLTAVIDQVAESIMITNTSGVIIYVNPAFEQINGYSAKEAIGNTPGFLESGEHDDSFYSEIWASINRGSIWKGRIVNKSKEGKRCTQETTIAPVRDESGKIVNFVSVARDISQQLIIEAQLRQAQKLESIGELAAGIAHEINTPTQYVTTNVKFLEDNFPEILENLDKLNTIRNMGAENCSWEKVEPVVADMMDEENLIFLNEDIPDAIKESTEGLRRIAEIVKSVKQLAHPGEMQKSYHDLNGIIYDAVTVSTNEWKYVAEVEMELDDKLPPLYCLKGEMGQVILNLIVNSAHAIEQSSCKDSSIKGKILVKSYIEGDAIIIKIKDTGCGMPEHVKQKAFDPFFTTKKIGKGTGQGLAIAYNVIVNIHNGSIVLDSEEGVGTTVTMTLPLV